jgi:copper resistance protein C
MRTLRPSLRNLAAAILSGLGLLFLMAATASAHRAASTYKTIPAHAKVYKAIPAIGSTIAQAPTTVTVFTLENINPNPKKSNLFVYGPSGDLISQGNAKVALNDPRQMSITIKPSGNGVYVVRWITVSAQDGDPDEGAFVFTVKPAVPAQAPTTNHATPSTAQAGTGGIPLWVPIVAGVMALLVGFGGGFGIARNSSRSTVSTMRKAVAAQEGEADPSPTPTKRS